MTRSDSRRWGKVWCDLTSDQRLECDHYRIYIQMAGSVKYGTNLANIGQRLIASRLDLGQKTVGRRMAEMEEWGHIKAIPKGNGVRGSYEMLSPAFEAAPAAGKRYQKAVGSATVRQARAWAAIQSERA